MLEFRDDVESKLKVSDPVVDGVDAEDPEGVSAWFL